MKNTPKRKILMAVFNPIEFDGRVKRSAESLSTDYEVKIFCPKAEINQKSDIDLHSQIYRFKFNVKKYPTVVSLFLFWLQFIYISLRNRPDIIYSHDYFLSFPGFLVSKLTRAVSVYDAHELIIPKLSEQITKREKVFYFLEKLSIHKHDLIIAANQERADIMREHYSLSKKPIPIRNISKITLGSITRERILKKHPELLKKSHQYFVVYMGSIDLSRGLKVIIDSINFLPDTISLILIGDGPDRRIIEKKISTDFKDRIRLTGIMPQDWIQDALSLCDVGVLVYGMDDLNNFYCSPNKIFEYTQAGLPVVSTGQPPMVKMINHNSIGEIAGETGVMPTANDLANSISKILDNSSIYKHNAKEFSRKNDFRKEGQILLNEINNIFNTQK